MLKPDYISFIEQKEETIFSRLIINEKISFDSVNEKSLILLFVNADYYEDKLRITEKIYKTTHGFYVFIRRNSDEIEKGDVEIFFNPNQIKELQFFLKYFIKQTKK